MTKPKFQIKNVKAREILDSRGQSTIEVEMKTLQGRFLASCPSGTSVGKYEAPVLRSEDAAAKINELSLAISRNEFSSQPEFDNFLKKQLPFSNVTLPLSIAFSRAFRTLPKLKKKILPKLLVLAFEGGTHGDSTLKIQEFLMVANNLKEGVQWYQKLKNFLEKKKIDTDTGLEGGFSPNNLSDEEALKILSSILPKSAKLGLDFGGSYFENRYPKRIEDLVKQFKVKIIEDPFGEDDFESWKKFYRKFGKKCLVVGDDLVVTDTLRLTMAARAKLINAVIVKPNQIGTVSETLEFVEQARKYNFKIIVSHRSGETNDSFVVDLAFAVGADYVKFGGLDRGERIAKYNRLLELS
jgi:enolase